MRRSDAGKVPFEWPQGTFPNVWVRGPLPSLGWRMWGVRVIAMWWSTGFGGRLPVCVGAVRSV
jgi:hypothetical protein